MHQRLIGVVLAISAISLAACGGREDARRADATTTSEGRPYAGLTDRPTKALSPERVEDLLAGRGTGYALAAELNHYPGPSHVLELRTELGLSVDQERLVRESFTAMQTEAKALGRQVVDAEAALDEAFRTAVITSADLERRTGEIAGLDGRLRAVHLGAHLRMKDLLTTEQVKRYDHLRGYPSADGEAAPISGSETDHQRHHAP